VLRALVQRACPVIPQRELVALWLPFLPNAPYIHRLQHLSIQTTVPAWHDVALLISCAGTGLLLAILSR
jgi:uncharacterized membrane protein